MNHAQTTGSTGRRPDFAASYHAKKLFDAPLFAVTNKELLKAARNAVRALRLDRSERQALEQLALCFGGQQLAHGLLCWPSNASICDATGMSDSTVRRALSKLCRRGLITPRESANGKRFPIKNASGEIVDARGFDLTPLYARAGEFADQVRIVEIDRRLKRQLRDDLTAIRNKVYDLCAADAHSLAGVAKRADSVPRPCRESSPDELAAIVDAFAQLAEEARTLRYAGSLSDNISGYAHQNDGHTEQEANPSIEDCNDRCDANAPQHPHEKRASGATFDAIREEGAEPVRQTEQRSASFELVIPKDLSLWREACPEIEAFAPVRSIEEASATGATLIKACGLARHAYEDAVRRLGAVNAGLLALFVYQRHADGERPGGTPVRSPGGLFVTFLRGIVDGREELTKHLHAMQRRRRAKRFH